MLPIHIKARQEHTIEKMSYRHLDNMQCVHTNYLFQNFVFDENSDDCKVPDEEDCPICFEPFSKYQCVILPCRHVYHQKCYFDHVKTQQQQHFTVTCPDCRSEPDIVWNLPFGEVQHASIRHPVLPVHDGYGLHDNIMEFLTDLCKREDCTFASTNIGDNQIYKDRYKLLVDRVYDEIQPLQLNGLYTQQLLEDYIHGIIQSFQELEASLNSPKYQNANILFKENSYEKYAEFLEAISVGNAWPTALYRHMIHIYDTYWPMIIPDFATIGINPHTGLPLLQPNNMGVPVVDKHTTLICKQLLLQAFQFKNLPIASRTRSHI